MAWNPHQLVRHFWVLPLLAFSLLGSPYGVSNSGREMTQWQRGFLWVSWCLYSCGPVENTDLTKRVFEQRGVFDNNEVLRISLTMDDDDWDAMRNQSRHGLEILGETCNLSPPESPYTFFSADVWVNGEKVSPVGVRKKGLFGSGSRDKPSLRIKFSEYVEGQLFHGMKRMTLNNNVSDASQIKQCLGYSLFSKAGVPAPRCNFATVQINGVDLGVYTHVEAIKKRFLARHFTSDNGALYEGALTTDFRPGWVNTFARKTNKDETDRTDLDTLVSALKVDNALLLESLDPVLDVDAFLTFWAMEVMLMHADGYARSMNNYYVYHAPTTQQFSFIPWGIDSILYRDRAKWWEKSVPPGIAWAEGALARRLYLHPGAQARYLSRMQLLLDTVWDESDIVADINRMEQLLLGELGSASEQQHFTESVAVVRAYIESRRAELESVLEAPAPAWETPPRPALCLAAIGTVSGVFSTRWQTLDKPNILSEGSGTVDLLIGEESFNGQFSGAVAGFDSTTGANVIRIVFRTPEDRSFLLQMAVDERSLDGPFPADIKVHPGQGAAYELVGSEEGMANQVLRAEFDATTIHLNAAGTEPLSEVSGSFSATLYPAD